jgi:hypothetical protein
VPKDRHIHVLVDKDDFDRFKAFLREKGAQASPFLREFLQEVTDRKKAEPRQVHAVGS